ncbi:hypothetical protein ACH5RR_009415 [Cinchona calisaya]|uniref:Uncharacterized protein n=1 Tax=Cinchona calisaya TaxID=153742 RepID=A0ABD3AG45_9GENT
MELDQLARLASLFKLRPPYSTSLSIKKDLSPFHNNKVSFEAVACWVFHHPIHNKSNETWRKISEHEAEERSSSPKRRATQMFQFAKFEKSKERRLATELGYGFPIGDPWITDGISPWPFASESVLPSQCPGIHPMHSF